MIPKTTRIVTGSIVATALALAMIGMTLQRAAAQGVAGRITGTVMDTSRAALPDVTVTATDISTGRAWKTLSDKDGNYNFPILPTGTYSVSAELSGFKKFVAKDLTLEINQVARIDLMMEVGQLEQAIEVTASGAVLQTDSTQVGTVIGPLTNSNLPLNGRNFISLTLLTPGVVATNPSSFTNGQRSTGGGRPYVNGNRKEANNFQLDGVDNNQTTDNLTSYQPSLDAIQEFKLITNNAPAEFGNFQGGIINVMLKSGTNDFHGAAFEFLRNDKLNANSWARNWTADPLNPGKTLPRPVLRHNVFGGTIGGPIIKNKLFFFGDYQGTRRRPGFAAGAVSVIPDAMRRGDFSSLLPAQQLFDPFSTRPDPNNPARVIRDPFPNNQIPLNLINPVAARLFASSAYPVPTLPGLVDNFRNQSRTTLDNNQFDVKIDSKLSDQDDLVGRFSYGLQKTLFANTFGVLMGSNTESPFRAFALSWTKTFNPHLFNEARFGFNRIVVLTNGGIDVAGIGKLGEQLGIPGVNDRGPGLPSISFGGAVSAIGSTKVVQNFFNNTFQYQDNLTMIRSSHVIKTGILVLRYQQNTYYSGNNGQIGLFDFNGQYTRDLNNPSSRGSAIADFFLGFPSRIGRGAVTGTWGHRTTLWAGFIQDDWRVTPALTLNLGLRYEYRTPFVEVRDRQANFDLTSGRELFANRDGNSRGLFTAYKRDFQPRVGFAWNPGLWDRRFVMRGAYTVSSFLEGTGTNLRLTLNPPFFNEFETLNSNPAMLGTPISQGFAALRAQDPLTGTILRAWDPKHRPARVQQWNLTTEFQATRDIAVSVGYVGQHGTHLVVPINFDQRISPNGPRPLDFIYPQIQFVVLTAPAANQKYDALQMTARQRFSHGLEFMSSYTWSHGRSDAIGYYGEGGQNASQAAYWANPRNQKAEWGPTYFDVRHTFSFSSLYDLPWGRGQRYFSSVDRGLNLLVGGWSLGGMLQLHTGFPVTVLAPDVSQTGSRTGRPDRIGSGEGLRLVGPGNRYFDTDAFRLPQLGRFGNSGVGVVRGPGLRVLDLSINKRFWFTEGTNLEFRTEFFNLTNSPVFNAPERSITSQTYGQVRNSQLEREIQFGLKLNF